MNVHKDSRIHPAISVYPGALWALFDNPKNTCHFLLRTLKQKLLKTFAVLFATSNENRVSIAERGSVFSWQVTTRENEKGAEKKKLKNNGKKKNVSDDNTL